MKIELKKTTDPEKIKEQEWIKWILDTPIPRHLELTNKFVLILPGSVKGGPGKSSTVITAAAGLRILGIPFLIGTYDTTNDTLPNAFGKESIVILEAGDDKQTRDDLAAFKKRCVDAGAIGIIDLPGAVNNQTSVLIENLGRARILELGYLILICPVRPDRDEIEGAYAAIEIFDPNVVLLRAWRPSRSFPNWDTFAAWKHLQKFPIWHCDNWTTSMKEVLTRSGNYARLPIVPEIPQYLADNASTLDDVARLDIEDVVDHLHHVAAYLYHTVLKDITRPVPGSDDGTAATQADADEATKTLAKKTKG